MVSKKRLHYGGFDGFHSPVVPKAPRSIRRNPHKKSSIGTEICPFELLAAVAGKLLQESEGSASSNSLEQKDNVKQEPLEVKVKVKPDLDNVCCAESQFVPEPSNLDLKLEPPLKESLHSDNDSGLEHASIVTTSDFFKEIVTNVKLEGLDTKNIAVNTPSKSEGDLCDVNMDTNIHIIPKILEKESENSQDRVTHCVLNKSYSSVDVPFYRGRNVKLGNIRDDDENSFYNTKMKAFRLQSRGGYRRMRKMFSSSKYWKTGPKLKDYEVNNTTRKNGFKKRKVFHHNSKTEYVEETSSESISNLPERHPSKRVKFSIKSFKVPELYLEMPETSTVGSLKRSVMEALTAILGGELHIGVLFQGEKVRDDNITLQQTGISLNSDTLGFILEPTLPEPSESPIQKQPPMSPQSDIHQPLSTDSPVTDASLSNSSVGVDPQIEKSGEEEEIVVETNINTNIDTKAIVAITEAVPVSQKLSKRTELSQRRTRRPFSVSEVEGLVEAVETLGTGRWRDVKIRAFDDANHRTYVDLKDKWKTLVHTASISPQQRRGEPVPQNLLDRVLAAHGFWLQHQSKQNVKVGTPVKVCLEMEG